MVYGTIYTSSSNQDVVEAVAIKDGKYADFILVDKNVLECPTNEIHSAKTQEVCFEGKKAYDAQ